MVCGGSSFGFSRQPPQLTFELPSKLASFNSSILKFKNINLKKTKNMGGGFESKTANSWSGPHANPDTG